MKTIKLIWKIFQSALLILLSIILLCNLYMIGAKKLLHKEHPTLFGWYWAVVVTGSMEPVICGNDMVVAKAQSEYEIDDIIIFESGNVLVTHRIVGKEDNKFITKGDANNVADANSVAEDEIVGKIVYTIPKAGVVLGGLKTPLGMTCLVLLGFLLVEIPYYFEKRMNERK